MNVQTRVDRVNHLVNILQLLYFGNQHILTPANTSQGIGLCQKQLEDAVKNLLDPAHAIPVATLREETWEDSRLEPGSVL